MKGRYLEALGELENMQYFADKASDDDTAAEELGMTTKQAAYMAGALSNAIDALESGVDDANLVPIEE